MFCAHFAKLTSADLMSPFWTDIQHLLFNDTTSCTFLLHLTFASNMALLKVLLLSFATLTASVPARPTPDINDRINCALVEKNLKEEECKSRGCHWSVVNDDGAPWCYLDRQLTGYTNPLLAKSTKLTNGQGFESTLTLKTTAHKLTPTFKQLPSLKLTVSPLNEHILRIRLTDPAAKRYEVPVQSVFNIPSATNWARENRAYDVSLSGGDFHLKVSRRGSGSKGSTTLLDTSIGGLVYSDQFIHFATYLASPDVYGFGENYHLSFRRETNYTTLPIFARDHLVGDLDSHYYGHHPVVQIVERDGKAHGLFLLNSNAMAYTLLPSPALSLKMAGGIIDLFLFVGDSPEHIVQLYTSLVGRPVMPPFWALGYQQCRYGYKTTDDVKKVVQRTLKNHIPLDVLYMDIDYMDEYRDFTYSKTHFAELPQYINETKVKHNLRWTLILDPAIQGDKKGYSVFDEGYKRDVFIKWPQELANSSKIIHPKNVPADKRILYGKVWPKGPAAFPDFFKNSTVHWWKKMIKNMHQDLKFDALWTDMNEPSNIFDEAEWYKCPADKYAIAYPAMKFNEPINSKTICMSSVQGEHGEYRHYDVHSLYGWSETKPTLDGLHEATGKRGFVLTRSTYPSSGQYAAHWLGDNDSSWEQLRQSIIGMLEFSLFGLSFVGADICGFRGNTTAELCRRWFVLGAYSPFSRSHNDIGQIDQDPGVWTERGHQEVTEAARLALRTRYQLLHYLYTRFYLSHRTGETLVRPVHHEFPQDPAARDIDEQFFLGLSIMVNPFLFENQTFHNAYAPEGAEWYRMENSFVSKAHRTSGHVHFAEADSHRPLLLRAASILPVVSESKLPAVVNTANLRKVPLELWVLPNSTGSASGELFFDDGESIDTVQSGDYNFYAFKLSNCELSIKAVHFGYKAKINTPEQSVLKVDTIKVALSSTKAVNTESLHVSISGSNSTHLKATIEHKTLNIRLTEALDLLKSGSKVAIKFKNQLTGECFTH